MATLAAMIEWLMARRPVVAALLIIATCFLLLRPIKKPRAQPGRDVATRAQKPPPQKRSVSISTAEVVLQFGAGAPQIIGGAVDALVTIARAADVYLVTQLPRDCDELETEAMRLLDGAGIFGADRCDRRKVVFCATEDGKGAICRQLSPTVHVDTSAKVLSYLAPHLPSVVQIGSTHLGAAAGPAEPTWQTAASLADYVRAQFGPAGGGPAIRAAGSAVR